MTQRQPEFPHFKRLGKMVVMGKRKAGPLWRMNHHHQWERLGEFSTGEKHNTGRDLLFYFCIKFICCPSVLEASLDG